MGKKLIAFNVKNIKYAVLKSEGTYDVPVAMGYADAMALEADYSEKKLFGDGRVLTVLPNDKGKTGTMTLLTIDEAYEIAMNRRTKTANGTAEIRQMSAVDHAIYFEFEYMEENSLTKTAKVWLHGVNSGRPTQTFNQTTDDVNNNNVDYPLTITGIAMKDKTGASEYKDENGNSVFVWQEICLPEDAGYETFGETCKIPQAPATE